MAKEVITEKELADWMNNYLHKEEGCEDAQIQPVYRLAELSPEGNNWSPATFRWSSNYGTAPKFVEDRVRKTFEEALKSFNLVE